MMKFIEKRDYRNAYQLSCLGASNNDFKVLGIEALNNQEFEIAMKCFQRV
jgi:intraflagellar transport protein 122